MRGSSQKEGGSVAALFVRSNRLPQCQMMCGLHRRRLGADFSLPSIGRYFISNQTFGHLIKAVSGSGAVPCPNSEFRHNLSNCCCRTRALDVQHSSEVIQIEFVVVIRLAHTGRTGRRIVTAPGFVFSVYAYKPCIYRNTTGRMSAVSTNTHKK